MAEPINIAVNTVTFALTADRKTAAIYAPAFTLGPVWQGPPKDAKLLAAAFTKLIELYELEFASE